MKHVREGMSASCWRGSALRRGAGVVGLGLLCVTIGCRERSAQQRRALDEEPAKRLVGAWDATLWLERPITLSIGVRTPPESISGTMAFLVDRRGEFLNEALPEATHVGVYDIDLGAFGIRLQDPREVPVLIARTKTRVVAAEARVPDASARESVTIVIDPSDSRYPFQLNGVFTADRITGSWTAGQSLGGGGRFVLRPHRTLP